MSDLQSKLKNVERLAQASRFGRLFAHPTRYIFAMAFLKMIYPFTKKGIVKQANVFFGLKMNVLLPAGTDIYLTGGKSHDSEIRLARFLINQLKPGDTFLDIGAHFGYFSLLAATLVRRGKVFSIEASANTFEILKKNVGSAGNVVPMHKAVSSENGALEFLEFPVLYSEYNTLEAAQFEHENWYRRIRPQKIMVEAVTLDSLLASFSAPVLIKIDVEGAEDKAIEGGLNALKTNAFVVIMEYLAPGRHNENHRKALQMMEKIGYRAHVINPAGGLDICPDMDGYLLAKGLESDNVVFLKK